MKKILIISIAMIMTMLAGFGVPYFMNRESRVDLGDRHAISNEVNNSGSDKNFNNSNGSEINVNSNKPADVKNSSQSDFKSNNINMKSNNGVKNDLGDNKNNNIRNNNNNNSNNKNNNNNDSKSQDDNIIKPTPFPVSSSAETSVATLPSNNNYNTELPYNLSVYIPTPIPTNPSSTQSNSRNKTIEERIQEHRAEILDEDLADFRRIFPRVDTAYLSRYDLNNITPEQLDELTTYLNNTLGSDLQRGLELYYKYSHLL